MQRIRRQFNWSSMHVINAKNNNITEGKQIIKTVVKKVQRSKRKAPFEGSRRHLLEEQLESNNGYETRLLIRGLR